MTAEAGRPTPALIETEARLLVGMSRAMTLGRDETPRLWRSFMPRRGEIAGRSDALLYAVQVHDPAAGPLFAPDTRIVKWAAVAVDGEGAIPDGMARMRLPGGRYLSFEYRGRPADFAPTARWLFGEWLPASGLRLDDRPHFELLEEGWRPDDPDARETIRIPVR